MSMPEVEDKGPQTGRDHEKHILAVARSADIHDSCSVHMQVRMQEGISHIVLLTHSREGETRIKAKRGNSQRARYKGRGYNVQDHRYKGCMV